MNSSISDLHKYNIAAVIPCYRLEREIISTIENLPRYLQYIVVVDDASTDATAELVTQYAKKDRRIVLIRHKQNQGVGGAMITGFRKALELEAQFVVKIDGDDQMDATHIPELLAPLIQSGALGKVLTIHAHWGEYLPQWHPWEDYRQSYAARKDLGGGVIRTLTQPLDYLRYLIGEVESLWSCNGHISGLEINVEDVAEIGLKFSSGAIGGVHLNYIQRPPRHTLEIVGTNGTLCWDNADGTLHFSNSPAAFGSFSDNPSAPVTKHFLPLTASNGTNFS